MIKVILVDDHKMFIDGLKSFLKDEKDIHVVDVAYTGQQVFDLLESSDEVDVIILDIEMEEINGIEVTREIVQNYSHIKILITSMHNKKRFILELMSLGVSGYVLKEKSKEELLNAIHNVYNNKPHFSLEVLSSFTEARKNPSPKIELTEREEEVLILVAEGFKTKEVAAKLFISTETVSVHRKNIKRKTGLENTAQLIRYAIRHGYIEL